jgi:CheY-like chemotaxis protein
MFRQLNVDIDIAKSTEEALDMLKNGKYDLIISDMARDNKPNAGIEFLQQFHQEDKTIPVIFYVGIFNPERGIPPLAFGITNRPDELLHLTLDVLERKKN